MKEHLFPFAWVQQSGVFYLPGPDRFIGFRQNASPLALAEAVRIAPSCPLRLIADEDFTQQIIDTYRQDASQARQMMENLGNEIDFFQLAQSLPEDEDLLDCDDGAPVIRFINAMLSEAIKETASDIHIEPYERQLLIRFRVDGVLRAVLTPPRQLTAVLISRIKVMARLDIAEKRLPQDGRIALRIGGRAVDVRVSTLPSRYGERLVLRLLDKSAVQLDLAQLGMDPTKRDSISELLSKPHGIILVTGPTGSGKSTTLYAALNQINSQDRNIMTVEDPIEYELEGIGQTQVNPKVDMTFARGLRAILRQDPDVVMIGEIRDTETAKIAVQASLTGHLVLSTLHTNTAIGAVGRLRDMGVEPFLLASSLTGILAQRLVRTLCRHCRQATKLSAGQLSHLGFSHHCEEAVTVYQPAGCEDCNQTGYRGRTGIHELLMIDAPLRQAIAQGQSEDALEQITRRSASSVRDDGWQKVLEGITSLEEVSRVTGLD
ncbi:type II secretion system ATPase GspE [Erwinia psidii]|uniref:Type II secretion system protein E n=1 Tax=Erwinia psidii TaxID=69224 RepID=A0A3N6UMB4_9GAMM|nr:type II secretion system ATPase GspE [Erwinia psidii]MCX8958079.1 type II secretion system protein GspE [Erwinia psidii]MCX8962479.1 type II secretion system protein GspE [Erwinia psidii]MCX8966387.1 type II secretion system protein GspE [Erwinia psidii]RQM37059.1 type II secretion system protein GspE [Erwinia psidii]